MSADSGRTYSREEITGILDREDTPLSQAYLRKAIVLRLIPHPHRISRGRGKLRFEYTETALAHARILAQFFKGGKTIQDFKAYVESASIAKLADVLDFIEQATHIHADDLGPVVRHAQLALQTVARANRRPEVAAWLSRLTAEVSTDLAGMPTPSRGRAWTAWLARTRQKLEEHNTALRSKASSALNPESAASNDHSGSSETHRG